MTTPLETNTTNKAIRVMKTGAVCDAKTGRIISQPNPSFNDPAIRAKAQEARRNMRAQRTRAGILRGVANAMTPDQMARLPDGPKLGDAVEIVAETITEQVVMGTEVQPSARIKAVELLYRDAGLADDASKVQQQASTINNIILSDAAAAVVAQIVSNNRAISD